MKIKNLSCYWSFNNFFNEFLREKTCFLLQYFAGAGTQVCAVWILQATRKFRLFCRELFCRLSGQNMPNKSGFYYILQKYKNNHKECSLEFQILLLLTRISQLVVVNLLRTFGYTLFLFYLFFSFNTAQLLFNFLCQFVHL